MAIMELQFKVRRKDATEVTKVICTEHDFVKFPKGNTIKCCNEYMSYR